MSVIECDQHGEIKSLVCSECFDELHARFHRLEDQAEKAVTGLREAADHIEKAVAKLRSTRAVSIPKEEAKRGFTKPH